MTFLLQELSRQDYPHQDFSRGAASLYLGPNVHVNQKERRKPGQARPDRPGRDPELHREDQARVPGPRGSSEVSGQDGEGPRGVPEAERGVHKDPSGGCQ